MHKNLTHMAVLAILLLSRSPLRADSPAQTNLPAVKVEVDDKEELYNKMELLTEIIMQVKRNYVEEKEYVDIVNGAIHGMLQSLDPHSDYLEPEAYEDIREDTSGHYGGVGIHIGIRNDVLTVIAPIEDSPAFKAGILAGDRIVAIDEVKTRRMKLSEAVDKIRGEKGSTVLLTIIREGEDDPLDFTLKRGDIEVASVKGARIIRNDIGYVRITQFSAPTADALQKQLDGLFEKGMKGLVLDLRNNPGGLVKSSVDIAQKFLNKGELIVSTRGRKNGAGNIEQKASGDVHYVDMPLVVLVNEGSASAAEIVSGALQDQGRAVLLGEKTYGKGSVQSILPLRSEEDSGIRLTTAHYYTPSGKVIHERGIDPDILVYVPPSEWLKVQQRRAQVESPDLFSDEEKKQFANVMDRQLERAVDLVEAMMIYEGIAGAGRK